MKMRFWLSAIVLVSFLEIVVLIVFLCHTDVDPQDTIAVNEIVKSLERGGDSLVPASLEYVLLDENGAVCFRTREHLSESIQEAISHRDTILDIGTGKWAGSKLIIYNDAAGKWKGRRQAAVMGMAFLLLVQWGLLFCWIVYLDRILVRPFQGLQEFARRVAGGNLDIPLIMDRGNIFGAFTESFDIMRTELKQARMAEIQANESKKELVAKLSHDIRTPVASIKAVSEVGAALAEAALVGAVPPDNGKMRENYRQIIRKADQINALVSDLFTATLEEMQQLAVTPADMESSILIELLENADYLHRGTLPQIPGCLLWADRLRLQQVFDNIFANSYKYAGTEIRICAEKADRFMKVSLEDCGGGVPEEELPLLKERFRRGSNAEGIDGAGLGLYIADSFMDKMQGELKVENGAYGLRVSVLILLSGEQSVC